MDEYQRWAQSEAAKMWRQGWVYRLRWGWLRLGAWMDYVEWGAVTDETGMQANIMESSSS